MQMKQSFNWLFLIEIRAILIIQEAKLSLRLCHFESDRNETT